MFCYGSEWVNIFIFLCISTHLERLILCENFDSTVWEVYIYMYEILSSRVLTVNM